MQMKWIKYTTIYNFYTYAAKVSGIFFVELEIKENMNSVVKEDVCRPLKNTYGEDRYPSWLCSSTAFLRAAVLSTVL